MVNNNTSISEVGTGYSKEYQAIKIEADSEQELMESMAIVFAPPGAFDFIDDEWGGECNGE